MNKVCLVGRLSKNIELRYTQKGKAVAQTTLAINRIFKREGEQEADFINIILWGNNAENASKYLSKGNRVGFTGRIQSRSYTANDGTKRYITEVVADEVEFMETKKHEAGSTNEDDFQPIEDDGDLPF